MSKSLLIVVFVLFDYILLTAQIQPVVYVGFDTCKVQDKGSLGTVITTIGEPDCECGLQGESFDFDGIRDGLVFDSKVNPLFDKDFTIEFYFATYNRYNITDILSFKNECSGDSSFSLQYLPTISEIRFFAKGPGLSSIEIDVRLDDSKCWHHVAIIRDEYEFYLFLDGKIAGQGHADREYFFAKNNN